MIYLLHSQYSIDYILKLPLQSITNLLLKAIEREKEGKAWELYLTKYPMMDSSNVVSFEEFYNPKPKPKESNENEILLGVKESLDNNKGNWIT